MVTGASAGIGRATARALATEGANVVVGARTESELKALAETLEDEYGVVSVPVKTDVRSPESVDSLVETTVETFDSLDVLVCNAGLTGGKATHDEVLEDMDPEGFRAMTETNVHGAFYATHAALPHLRESKGNLVFVGSSAGKYPRPGNPVYAGTKWWLRGFARSVEAHAGADGVAVSLVNPTAVRTDAWKDTLGPGEAAEPEEIAEVVVFVCTRSGHTTISEVDVFRRDMLGKFIPEDIDVERSF